MPHSYSNSDLFVHCVLKTRFVSSFVPGIVNGKPTPILRAAAVGTDIGRETGKMVAAVGASTINETIRERWKCSQIHMNEFP